MAVKFLSHRSNVLFRPTNWHSVLLQYKSQQGFLCQAVTVLVAWPHQSLAKHVRKLRAHIECTLAKVSFVTHASCQLWNPFAICLQNHPLRLMGSRHVTKWCHSWNVLHCKVSFTTGSIHALSVEGVSPAVGGMSARRLLFVQSGIVFLAWADLLEFFNWSVLH